MSEHDIQKTLQSLQIPSEYARYESTDDISRLDTWKASTVQLLRDLSGSINEKELSVIEQADVIAAVASFSDTEPWTSAESRALATGTRNNLLLIRLLF